MGMPIQMVISSPIAQIDPLDVEGRTLWLIVYLLIIAVVVASSASKGWNTGLCRVGMSLVAILLGCLAGWGLSDVIGSILRSFYQYPRQLCANLRQWVQSCLMSGFHRYRHRTGAVPGNTHPPD